MKKFLLIIVMVFACSVVSPASAATTKTATKAKTVVVKKPVTKKVVVSKYGSAKNPIFSPEAAAKAMGTSTTDSMVAYQNALRAAQKLCIAAGSNKEKLAACDEAFKEAQALLGQ